MANLQGTALNDRSPYWDNIKGILIFLVVFGHFLWDYQGLGLAGFLVSFIYMFHMPAFIFIAGYFSKSDNSRSKRTLFRLVVIYMIFNTAIMLFTFFMLNRKLELLSPSYSYWFLISIIIWRLTIRYIEKVRNIFLISIAAAIFIGLWSDVTNVLAAARTIAFFPFFLAGYKLSKEKMKDFINNRKPIHYLRGILLLFVTACLSSAFILLSKGLNASDLLMESYKSLDGIAVRIAILGIAGLMTLSLVLTIPKRQLPLLSKWGRNSLVIFVLHRYITLVFSKAFPASGYDEVNLILALLASILTMIVLGADVVSHKFNWLIDRVTGALMPERNSQVEYRQNLFRRVSTVLLVIFFSLPIITVMLLPTKAMPASKDSQTSSVHEVITKEQKAALKDSVSIAFVGDLILLQDQVRKAYSEASGEYEFAPMFEYASKYLKQADLAIGVFEGPMAGEEAGYSTSNYDDGIPIYLNYPDSFAKAVKDSGIDLVTTANNHLLDKGKKGALRTLDVLDEAGLLHVGSYRNEAEKNSVMIVEKGGVRIAVLAYTSGSNGYNEEYFLRENITLTSTLAAPDSKYFDEVKAKVLSDFKRIKNMDNPPDLIAVLPHMGTQFIHETDKYQDTWNDIFIEAGADIILGDHSHAVQPIEFKVTKDEKGKEKKAIIVNSPGNFANSYIEKDGDATAIVEVYIDPKNKEVISAGVIPMYTQSPSKGNYRALPIYSILNEPGLQKEISSYEMKRVAEVQSIVSAVMLGAEVTLAQVQERYYIFPEGYVRQPVSAIEITDQMRASSLFKLLEESKKVCFVGDSITAGSENGGYGWYEPMTAAFPDKKVYKEAWGGATTQTLLKNSEVIAGHDADLYVIAIGTNDVRYRDKQKSAMDKESYIENIDELIGKIKTKDPNTKFVLISPWLAQDNDPFTKISIEKRDLMLAEYGAALEAYCKEKGYAYINPNPAIDEVLTRYAPSDYLIDHIHPNAGAGIRLYSEKVLEYYKDQ